MLTGLQMKILIVDDNFINRKILLKFLEDKGEVDIAVNGLEAMEAIKLGHSEGAPYDLVLLDIMMPEMDGQETLQAIRAFEKEKKIYTSDGVKIIMVTALTDSKNIMQSFRMGCENYITKPVERDKLMKAINNLGL